MSTQTSLTSVAHLIFLNFLLSFFVIVTVY